MAELLRNKEAVAHGLSVMATRMLFEELPSILEYIIGGRQATIILERMAEEAAEEGFREFMRMLGFTRDIRMPLEKLITIFLAPPSNQPKTHPFQVVKAVRVVGGRRIVLEVEEGHKHPSELGILAGTIAGVLTAAGYRAKPLSSPETKRHICSANNEPPQYLVYPVRGDDGKWKIIIEEVNCARQADAA